MIFIKKISTLKRKMIELIFIKKVFLKKIVGISDYSRWKKKKAFHLNWDERTKILALYIRKNSRVFEFGAGRLSLREMLPQDCEYLHSDLVKRNEDTLVVDLNKSLPEIPKVDFVVFSGVLEYVNDIETLIKHLAGKTNCFLFSYATLDKYNSVNFRRSQGWISDLSSEDIIRISKSITGQLEVIGEWNNQTLFSLKTII